MSAIDPFLPRTRIAYFSMEMALRPEMKTYSGGLGVLAGDTARSCADLDLPVVFVTLASSEGYLRQEIDVDGRQFEHADYGFPLTLYLLAGWLGTRFPALDPLSHDAGHLWPAMFGWSMDPHWSPLHLLSFVFIGGGFILIAAAWRVLHDPQRKGKLATAGPYARLLHPQYVGFVLIMIGFFLRLPTLVTGLMLPMLLVMYWRLAKSEERGVEAAFGDQYRRYASTVPAFLPRPASLLRSSRG